MDATEVDLALNVGLPVFLLIATYFIGTRVEESHYRSIRARERKWMDLPVLTFERLPPRWEVEQSEFVMGSVVISLDYFKRFLAGLRGIVGGRIKSYESLLDRARREALLRLKQRAIESGCHAVVNVRLETSRLANARSNGQGTAGVEVLAFGTGLVLRRPPVPTSS